MRAQTKIAGVAGVLLAASLALPVIAQEKKADEAKKGTEPAKAKAEKVAGDIGLLDTEKNYMIVVTKEGKLVTLDYNSKTKAVGNQGDKGEDGRCRARFVRERRIRHQRR